MIDCGVIISISPQSPCEAMLGLYQMSLLIFFYLVFLLLEWHSLSHLSNSVSSQSSFLLRSKLESHLWQLMKIAPISLTADISVAAVLTSKQATCEVHELHQSLLVCMAHKTFTLTGNVCIKTFYCTMYIIFIINAASLFNFNVLTVRPGSFLNLGFGRNMKSGKDQEDLQV